MSKYDMADEHSSRTTPPEWAVEQRKLLARIAELEAEVARLTAENTRLATAIMNYGQARDWAREKLEAEVGRLTAEQERSTSNQKVWCALCVDRDSLSEVVHIFSTKEKRDNYMDTDPRNHVAYDYIIDSPETLEQVPS